MSRVRLDREWTDAEGITHAGDTVDVAGVLADPGAARIGVAGGPPAPHRPGAGPTPHADDGAAIGLDDADLGR
jgi:hypothetical protein